MLCDFGEGDVVTDGGSAAAREVFGVSEEVHPVVEGEAWAEGGWAGASAGVAGEGGVVHGLLFLIEGVRWEQLEVLPNEGR